MKEEGKKGPSSSKACQFCHREGHWKNDCKHRQEWLKKKRQVVEADIALSSLEEIEVLMASKELLKVKTGYLIQVVRFMYIFRKSYSITP